MTAQDRTAALARIRSNITSHGQHVYTVASGPVPRYTYSIGISEVAGIEAELILAGAIFFSAEETAQVVNDIAAQLRRAPYWQDVRFEVAGLGSFFLRPAHASWADSMMLGALDYYAAANVPALQVVPVGERFTRDTPDLGRPWSAQSEPV